MHASSSNDWTLADAARATRMEKPIAILVMIVESLFCHVSAESGVALISVEGAIVPSAQPPGGQGSEIMPSSR